MDLRNKSIVLVDHHIEMNSDWLVKTNYKKEDIVILDPENLFSELDWTKYEDDVLVINTIYSRLFEEVVMNNKKLICFWPLDQQLGEEWFELTSLCKANSFELEVYKNLSFKEANFEFDEKILFCWMRFVYFLFESLLEDIRLNEKFDEIATLKSDHETIVLFKLEKEENIRYSFGYASGFFELDSCQLDNATGKNSYFQFFDTFDELLEILLKDKNLSLFESTFVDGSLEKAYFKVLSKEFKTKNLIENWLKTYSMN